ncbi:hypothetical protein GC209_01090 [bacterium]|nr:hypothetical protein [bacterium]
MALEQAEMDWITAASGRDIAKEQSDAQARNKQKGKILAATVGGSLANARDEISAAQDFAVMLHEKGAKKGKPMKWRALDEDTNQGILSRYELRADVEIDTVHDIDENAEEIPGEVLAKLNQSFERIKEVERNLRLQYDDNGEPLFTEAEIRNEVWTPLVRSGLIPDNMVPDEYSEHAVAFEGARELYAEKIAAFSEGKTKGREKLKRGLKIGKQTVSMLGSVASNSITIANAHNVATLKDQLKHATDNDVKTSLKQQIQHLEKMSTYAEMGATMLTGGLSLAELAIDHVENKDVPATDRWLNTFKQGVLIAQTMAGSAIDTGMRVGTSDGGYNADALITCVKCATNAGFTGVNMAATFAIVLTTKDEKKRLDMISDMIGSLGSAVADSINAVGGKVAIGDTTADYTTQAYFEKIAAGLKLAITQTGKAPQIYAAIKKGDTKALGLLLGGAAVAIALGSTAELVYDKVRQDVASGTTANVSNAEALFMQEDGEKRQLTQDDGVATELGTIGDSLSAIDQSAAANIKLDPNKLRSLGSQEELEKELTGAVAKKQQEIAEQEMAKAMSPEAMKAILEDADADVSLFGKTYSDAFPNADLAERKPEEIVQAQLAIERAMKNTVELRERVALINGITSAGAAVIGALVPGVGAVVAAQKLAYDIYVLVKSVETHNAWCDSMEFAMAGQGGVTAAIENTLKNAKIHLSHASVKVVLDSIKVSAEVAKVFDPTGAAAATSAATSMADAVIDFGYSMHNERMIDQGWKAYKAAISKKGDRKAARKALRLNSTLAKCCIAYGATIMGDTAAQVAIRKTGLTIAALKDDKDICVKLVAYLELQLNEDPQVLKVVYTTSKDWHPGPPRFDGESWTSFKAAAYKSAAPKLAKASLATEAIDKIFARLATMKDWSNEAKFSNVDGSPLDQTVKDHLTDETSLAMDLLERLEASLLAYAPVADDIGFPAHKPMIEVARNFATMARANHRVATEHLNLL